MMFNGVYMLSRHAGNGEKYPLIMEPREKFAICNLVADFGEDISTWFDCSLFPLGWGNHPKNDTAFNLIQQLGIYPQISSNFNERGTYIQGSSHYTWSKTSTTRNPA